MRIEHVAIWAKDLEKLKFFYEQYFNGKASQKYVNSEKKFESYFLKFDDGVRLELMYKPEIPETQNSAYSGFTGIVHFAFSVGSNEKVDQLTKRLIDDGFEVLNGPRITGDGYYESTVLDPENNLLEITV